MQIGDLTLSYGQNYTFVPSNGTPAENGEALRTAYSAARLKQPNGKPISATNRFSIVLAPGKYSLDNDRLTMTQDGLDLIGLGGSENTLVTSIVVQDIDSWSIYNADGTGYNTSTRATQFGQVKQTIAPLKFIPGNYVFPDGSLYSSRLNLKDADSDYNFILVTATDVKIEGISSLIKHTGYGDGLVFKDCSVLPYINPSSWNFTGVGAIGSAATYINCKFNTASCAGGAAGTFIGCSNAKIRIGDSIIGFLEGYSKQVLNICSGLFIDCVMKPGIASVVTETGDHNFGTPTGLFINCISGEASFGGQEWDYTGTLTYLAGVPTDTRTYTYNPATAAIAAGTFIGCVATTKSFGGGTGQTTAQFLSCKAGANSFGTLGTGGKTNGLFAATISGAALLA